MPYHRLGRILSCLDAEITRGAIRIQGYREETATETNCRAYVQIGHNRTLLLPADIDWSGYYTFTDDNRWIIRDQKTGSSDQTIYVYKVGKRIISQPIDLGERAWHFFEQRPEAEKVTQPQYHRYVCFLNGGRDGKERSYPYPPHRLLRVSLSGDVQGRAAPHLEKATVVDDWQCVYDLSTGKFTVPPEFKKHNASALSGI